MFNPVTKIASWCKILANDQRKDGNTSSGLKRVSIRHPASRSDEHGNQRCEAIQALIHHDNRNNHDSSSSSRCSSLEILRYDASYAYLPHHGMEGHVVAWNALITVLRHNTTLKKLSLSWFRWVKLDNDTLHKLVDIFKYDNNNNFNSNNTTLVHLDLPFKNYETNAVYQEEILRYVDFNARGRGKLLQDLTNNNNNNNDTTNATNNNKSNNVWSDALLAKGDNPKWDVDWLYYVIKLMPSVCNGTFFTATAATYSCSSSSHC